LLTILINDIIYDILHSLRKKKIWTVYSIKRLKQTFKLLYPIRVFMDFLISLLKNVNLEAKFGCIHNYKKKWRKRQFYLQWQLLSQHINTINHFQLVNVFTIFFFNKMELTFSVYSIKYSQTTHINYFLEPKPVFLVTQRNCQLWWFIKDTILYYRCRDFSSSQIFI